MSYIKSALQLLLHYFNFLEAQLVECLKFLSSPVALQRRLMEIRTPSSAATQSAIHFPFINWSRIIIRSSLVSRILTHLKWTRGHFGQITTTISVYLLLPPTPCPPTLSLARNQRAPLVLAAADGKFSTACWAALIKPNSFQRSLHLKLQRNLSLVILMNVHNLNLI